MLARGRMNSIGQLGKGHVARVLPAPSGAADCPSLAFCVDIGPCFPPFSGAKRICAMSCRREKRGPPLPNNRDFMSTRPHSDYGYLRGFSRRPA